MGTLNCKTCGPVDTPMVERQTIFRSVQETAGLTVMLRLAEMSEQWIVRCPVCLAVLLATDKDRQLWKKVVTDGASSESAG